MKIDSGKKTPFRMCVACKEMKPKSDLVRIVRKDESISIDYTGKSNGRGAYVCNNPDCIGGCLKRKLLNKQFKTNVDEEVYKKLWEEYVAKQS